MKDEATGSADDVEQLAAEEELKQRLIRRVAIAVVLIAALLGGLAVLDTLNTPQQVRPVEEPPVAALTLPKPEEAKPEEKPAEPPLQEEPKKTEEVLAEPEKSAPPVVPVKKEHAQEHAPRPVTKPAEARPAMLKPSETIVSTKPAPAPTYIAPLVRAPRPAAPASRPITQPPGQTPVFLLQMGVFNNPVNAEELRAKLELNGIPSQIESRVQVGPFKNRQEAEQMREKLKQLGMETGMLVATKR
ncbi:MAG: SPOR domain-containing protein [Sterolibacterium sp.]